MSIPKAGARPAPPRRSARFEDEPGYYEPAGLWFYGNIRLLQGSLVHVPAALGPATHLPGLLDEIERENFQVLHQRIALTPIRKLWISWRVR